MRKHFNTFFATTFIARIFGYIRDLAIAYFVGGGYWADLYFASFRIANFFRQLFAEGGLYAAYTPVYSRLLAKDKTDARRFALSYGVILGGLLTVAIIICLIFAHKLTKVLLPGFTLNGEKLGTAVSLTRILLPFLLFISLAAWAQATLQANGKFFLSSLSPLFASLSIIVFLLLTHHSTPITLIYGLAVATTIGGLAQLLVLLPQLKKTLAYGVRPAASPILSIHPEIKKSFLLFGPYVFTFMVDQVNAFVDTFFATFAETGAIAALYNASRLVQLPVGLVGVGSLVTLLPTLSQLASNNEKEKIRLTVREQLKRVLKLTLPAALGLMIFSHLIVKLLYFHGQFSIEALRLTSQVLIFLAPSLVFHSLQKICLALFYAHQNTRHPFLISVGEMATNVIGCSLLVQGFGVRGIALTSSITSLLGLLLMTVIIYRKGYLRGVRP